MAGSRTSIPTSNKKVKKGKLKKLGAGLSVMEIPYMLDLYSDAGLILGGLGEQIANLGLYKKGGKIKKAPRGCGVAMKGYGKAMKGSKQ